MYVFIPTQRGTIKRDIYVQKLKVKKLYFNLLVFNLSVIYVWHTPSDKENPRLLFGVLEFKIR